MNQESDFQHYHNAHCETGALRSLLTNHGFKISEPMVLGITSGLIFFFFPFVKMFENPMLSFRIFPRSIVKRIQKALGIQMVSMTYKDEKQAMAELTDLVVTKHQPVGLQTSISYLTYFMSEFRIYFNAHNTIVYGKENDEFLISDPALDHTTKIKEEDLQKARFAKGPLAPKGFIYYPAQVPDSVDYRPIIEKAIKKTVKSMLQPIFPFVGIKGIFYMANYIKKFKNKGAKRIKRLLSHIVLFQEEIGTGGAGFRFMYSAFLQEAGELLNMPELIEVSKKMTETGDIWREVAVAGASIIKGKSDKNIDLDHIAELYKKCGEAEKKVYLMLKKIDWK